MADDQLLPSIIHLQLLPFCVTVKLYFENDCLMMKVLCLIENLPINLFPLYLAYFLNLFI